MKKSEVTRAQILEAACQQFAKVGYHNTKISDIVQTLHLSQGTFYWHFKSKEAIVLEILQTGSEQLLEVIHKGYRRSNGTAEEMIKGSHRLLMDIFHFALENRYFMEVLLLQSNENESIQQMCQSIRQSVEDAFRANIESAVALKMLPAQMDVALRASFLTNLIEGSIIRWLFKNEERTAEEIANELVKFEFYGLFAQ